MREPEHQTGYFYPPTKKIDLWHKFSAIACVVLVQLKDVFTQLENPLSVSVFSNVKMSRRILRTMLLEEEANTRIT
jgi:hypothetical protein